MTAVTHPINITQLAALLPLLHYPMDGPGTLAAASRSLGESESIRLPLQEFADAMTGKTATEWEEEYTRAFDLSPIAIPYLSIHLYGEESYKRGAMMAWLNDLYTQHGFVTAGEELPDHLVNVLGFLLELPESEREELNEFCLRAPVEWMREKLVDARSPFQHVLRALQGIIGGAPLTNGVAISPSWDAFKSSHEAALPGLDTRSQWEQEFGRD